MGELYFTQNLLQQSLLIVSNTRIVTSDSSFPHSPSLRLCVHTSTGWDSSCSFIIEEILKVDRKKIRRYPNSTSLVQPTKQVRIQTILPRWFNQRNKFVYKQFYLAGSTNETSSYTNT